MRPPSDHELIFLLFSVDPRERKLALQLICETIEAGYPIKLERNLDIARGVANQKSSTDREVRLWLYKVIGLVRHREYLPYLKGQLQLEEDDEGRAWAAAALVAIEGHAAGTSSLKESGYSEIEVQRTGIKARYFQPQGPPIESGLVRKILLENDPLELRWLSLVYGKDPSLVPRPAVQEMNTHDHPLVSEYSLWALNRDPQGGITDARMSPQELPAAPENVRRWYYRLLTHRAEALYLNWDLVEQGMADSHPQAREGLAMGLAELQLKGETAERVIEWFDSEKDRGVRRALMKGFVTHRSRTTIYRRKVQKILNDQLASADVSEFEGLLPPQPRYHPARIFIVQRSSRRKATGAPLLGIPDFRDSVNDFFSFIAVDTVDFSSNRDSDQLNIVRSFIDNFRGQSDISHLPSSDLIPLLTGDGIILGIRGTGNAPVALRAALEIRRSHQHLNKFDMRFGVHCGSTNLITLSDNSRQLIGHAVNWSARVMACANANQVLISNDYYSQVLHSGREPLPGFVVEPVEGLVAKGGHAVEAYDVAESFPET